MATSFSASCWKRARIADAGIAGLTWPESSALPRRAGRRWVRTPWEQVSVILFCGLHHRWAPLSRALGSCPRDPLHTRGCLLSSGLEATGSACSGLAFDADVPPGRSFMEQEGGDVTSAT